MDITITYYHSPFGVLKLGSAADRLCLCDWQAHRHDGMVERRLQKMLKAEFAEGSSAVLRAAAAQLDEYFARRRRMFTVPLMFAGTDFQKAVWSELLNIPYGRTATYAEIARRMGMPNAVRAVANANGANALSVFVPCHRVVGSDGTLTGYAGGLDAKRALLALESENNILSSL